MPSCVVIPELGYRDVVEATRWLCEAFGFKLRLRIANHRAQLEIGDGAIVLTEFKINGAYEPQSHHPFAVMVRVDDVDSHYLHALRYGALITSEPIDQFYGERQYSCRDPGGHSWTFSQSTADVAPTEWGATVPGK
jgi:uncharacterized glyoxalase superfamily protein PhnB